MRCCVGYRIKSERLKSSSTDTSGNKRQVDDEPEDKISQDIKILLLGIAEAGKSTLMKQLKICYGIDKKWADSELGVYKDAILKNLKEVALIITYKVENEFGIVLKPLSSSESGGDEDTLLRSLDNNFCSFFACQDDIKRFLKHVDILKKSPVANEEVIQMLPAFFKSKLIKQYVDKMRYKESYISYAYHFIKDIDRVCKKNYQLKNNDILQVRLKTTGLCECTINIDSTKMTLYDVGGQRSESKKWVRCFHNTTAVIFLVGLDFFHSKQYMDETIDMFTHIWRSKWLADVPTLLFFNKYDSFVEKLKHYQLKDTFAGYTGENDPESALGYIKQVFVDQSQLFAGNKINKRLYLQTCVATHQKVVQNLFENVKEIAVYSLLSKYGMV